MLSANRTFCIQSPLSQRVGTVYPKAAIAGRKPETAAAAARFVAQFSAGGLLHLIAAAVGRK
jgi:hypothetical protein